MYEENPYLVGQHSSSQISRYKCQSESDFVTVSFGKHSHKLGMAGYQAVENAVMKSMDFGAGQLPASGNNTLMPFRASKNHITHRTWTSVLRCCRLAATQSPVDERRLKYLMEKS